MMILDAQQTHVTPGAAESLRAVFAARRCVVLGQILSTKLQPIVAALIDDSRWEHFAHPDVGSEEVAPNAELEVLFLFLLNAPEVLEQVRLISGCDDITWFNGRIYRLVPGTEHSDSWHDDAAFGRRVGLSIMLGIRPWQGGAFEIKRKDSDQLLDRVDGLRFGEATLFDISADLDHRVTSVTGSNPRIAMAGWYMTGQPSIGQRILSESD